MLGNLDPNSIQDIDGARRAIQELLNLVEEVVGENHALREENERLRDEINRLKGEQGRPKVRANKKSGDKGRDYSSERERRKPRQRKKKSKRAQVKIDREQVLAVDQTRLPSDAEFKGYEEVVVQDIEIKTDNVLFRKEKYYSPSEHRTYLAELPDGYEGQFGPGIKALVVVLYYGVNTSEPKIREFLGNVGIDISAGEVSNLLIKKQDDFHEEKAAIHEAGLRSSPWQHIDDTGTRVNGVNHHCHILCNPFYTAYITTARKDRLTVLLDVLWRGQDHTFLLNEAAYAFLERVRLAKKVIRQLRKLPQEKMLSAEEMEHLLEEHVPKIGPQQRQRVREAMGVAAYHAQETFPVIDLLLCDDAPQFNLLTRAQALCWVHEGRHYKKLTPYVAHHRQLLEDFRKTFWEFYRQILIYQQNPSDEEHTRLSAEFDRVFSTVTGYRALDLRIEKTKAKKSSLLAVLDHPEILPHNNPAELGARMRVRKRDVSFGPRTRDGTEAWDTFMTLAATAKKLGVSFYHYVHDRISKTYHMPYLADLIAERATQRPLALSWGDS
jgi:regulator of replication initiation timing